MRRSLVATGLLGLGLVALTRGAAVVPPAVSQGVTTPEAPPVAPDPDPEPVPALSRNPFEYDDGPRAAAAKAGLREALPVTAATTAAAPPVRLVGFVRRSGGLRAVLVLQGELELLAVGESARGYSLVSADEESGVRLRGPDGEIALAPEP